MSRARVDDLEVLLKSVQRELCTATGGRREELLDVLPEIEYQLDQARETLPWTDRRAR